MFQISPRDFFNRWMRRAFAVAILLCVGGAVIMSFAEETAGSKEPLTLLECYQLALKRSEIIAIQEQIIKEAEGRFTQYLNRILPDASFSYSHKIQNGGGGTAFTLSDVPESKFVFTQPIFSGFRDIARISGAKIEKEQRAQEKIRAQQLLFTDVVDAFYLSLNYQADYNALQATQNALQERIVELKKREELGRSRPSEVANAEARLSRVDADLEKASSDGEIARQLLAFLIGGPAGTLIDAAVDASRVAPLDEYLAEAELRPDILAAQKAWEISKKGIVMARAGHWPTVSAEGDYYLKRVGASQGVDWDATLSVSMPITTASRTIGEIKEATAKAREAELVLQQTKRTAILETQNAYTRWQSAIKRLTALEKALNAAEKNYLLQKEDYGFNLVNNLEVLQALEDLQDARRDFIDAKTELGRSYWDLKVKTGEISDDTR